MRIPILTYQPARIDRNDYAGNDLIALAADLRQVSDAGFRILPLRTIVDAWLDDRVGELEGNVAAITSDNGADFDYHDLPHPSNGTQRSVINILRDFAAAHSRAQPSLNVTSFVVASPEARAVLDATCLAGKGWWTDGWWRPAIESGLIHIANRSWDLNHEALPDTFSQGVARGTFFNVADERLADHEIRAAAAYLRSHAPNPGTALFAYPYGQCNCFLTREYFPRHGAELGIRAAFTTRPGFLEPECGKWTIPRFLFGRDWSSPAELGSILEAASDANRVWVAVSKPDTDAQRINGESEVAAFLAERVDAIPGWLHVEAALLTAHLVEAQREAGLSGPTLEIGVYKGKYLSLLYWLSCPGEVVVGVDLFVGTPDARGDVELVTANVAKACGEAKRLRIVVADSLELTSDALAKETGGAPLRFVSIDGGHTREIVLRDLESSYPLLGKGGIMALDDAFNSTTPGVIEGIADFFLRGKPDLAPFALCYNKMFVTTPDFHATYLREAQRFAEETTWLPMHERTRARQAENRDVGFTTRLFGYEVISFL